MVRANEGQRYSCGADEAGQRDHAPPEPPLPELDSQANCRSVRSAHQSAAFVMIAQSAQAD